MIVNGCEYGCIALFVYNRLFKCRARVRPRKVGVSLFSLEADESGGPASAVVIRQGGVQDVSVQSDSAGVV